MKYHLKRVTTNVKLTFEERQPLPKWKHAYYSGRPLVALPCDGIGIDMLTPGHFLIGRPIESLPDPSFSYRPISLCVDGTCDRTCLATLGARISGQPSKICQVIQTYMY
jgi:hypothetical protein